MLRVGIVGLPNVGKSTLFNALTKTRKAEAGNYPFCTIDPNVGVVTVPDPRLDFLTEMSSSQKTVPTNIEMVDIAGLVAGASQGEGLGNKFLSHIREVDAIVQVVRCFEDEDIHHVSGSVDPLRDIEVILTELILSDAAAIEKRKEKLGKLVRSGDKEAKALLEVIDKLIPHLDQGKPALTCDLNDDEGALVKDLFLLTSKPMLFSCNVREEDLAKIAAGDKDSQSGAWVDQVETYCQENLGAAATVVSAQIESELVELSSEEAAEYLDALGVQESGVGALIRAAYDLLGLRTYFTTGETESRAWTIRQGDKAPRAAGVIHTDFERGFIAAECVAFDALKELGSLGKARESGKLRIEGKEYEVQDGDVLEFRFNV
ncbi:MAG: redox-regulated ATPase YchF [Verrucomicrobiota bacterium]